MPSTFPKKPSHFGLPATFHKKVALQGYNTEYIDYEQVMYYLRTTTGIFYDYDNFLLPPNRIKSSNSEFIDQSFVFLANLFDGNQLGTQSPLKRLGDTPMEDILLNVKETTFRRKDLENLKGGPLRFKSIFNATSGTVAIRYTGVKLDYILENESTYHLRLFVPYHSTLDVSPKDNYAFILSTSSVWTFLYVLKLINLNYSDENKNLLRFVFKNVFARIGDDVTTLNLVYALAPSFILNERNTDDLFKDLRSVLKGEELNEIGLNEEALVLKILSSICDFSRLDGIYPDNPKATQILDRLIAEKVDGQSIFRLLYNGLNDYGGANNFTAFVDQILVMWMLSTYYRTGPYEINYDASGEALFYSDSYDFVLSEDSKRIEVYSKTDGLEGEDIWTRDGEFNVFHRFVIPNPESVQVAEQASVPDVMPAFYLKALDDKNRSANIEVGIFVALDLLTLFTGLGTLLRFRSLAAAFKVSEEAFLKGQIAGKVTIAGFQVTSGATSTILTLSKADRTPFGQKLRTCLFFLDILSLGADAVTSRLLKKTATEILTTSGPVKRTAENEEMYKLLEDLAELRKVDVANLDLIGKNLNAVRLTKLELDEWIKAINRLGGKVKYHTDNSKILKYFDRNGVGAAFDGSRVPPIIWIRKGDVTDLELFHECMHFEDFLRRGSRNYKRGSVEELVPLTFGKRSAIPQRDYLISKYIKEKYVLDKILEEQEAWVKKFGFGRFTDQEIEFSKMEFKRYIDDIDNFNLKNSGTNNLIDISKIIIK